MNDNKNESDLLGGARNPASEALSPTIIVHPAPVVVQSASVTVQPAAVTIETSPEVIRPTKVMAWTSVIMVLVSVALLVTSYLQWSATDSQLGVMSRQLVQNDEIIKQMRADHATAQNNAAATLAQMKEDNNVTQEQVEQNRAVLDQMRLENRAWLGVETPTIELEVGKPIKWSISIKNSGQTPALVERVQVMTFIRPLRVPLDPETASLGDAVVTQRSVAPNQSHRQPIDSEPALTQQVHDAIVGDKRTMAVYLVGKLHYRDVSRVARTTDFYMQYAGVGAEVSMQPTHNRMY